MDRLMENRWFLKIIAFLLAILLYVTVNFDPSFNQKSEGNVPATLGNETITNVPVKVYYDTDNLVVSGVPETVDVTVKGPKALVQSTKALKNFDVVINLANAEIGTQRVPIQIKDLSEKLKVTINPAYANISVEEKVTKEFEVDAEFNRSLVEEGYALEKPIIEPNKVKVTGAKNLIERISYVKATFDLRSPLNDTVTREASILVLDKNLNKLDVIVEPEVVEVKIPVKSVSKEVPIEIVKKGSLPKGIVIQSIELDRKKVNIFASEDILKQTEKVRVELDLSKVTGDTELSLPVIISDGISKVDPQLVKAKIQVEKLDEKSFSNIEIKPHGLANQYVLNFLDPSDGEINVTVKGLAEHIAALEENDMDLFINTAGLDLGTHTIKIQINGLDELEWELEQETVQVEILEKDEA